MQKGRGIGGLLRVASALFKPLLKSVGNTALKVAQSDAGKAIGKAVKEQAIKSAKNIALDTIRGENIKDSVKNEVSNVRKRVADTIGSTIDKSKKRKLSSKRRQKRLTYANLYSNGNDWLS